MKRLDFSLVRVVMAVICAVGLFGLGLACYSGYVRKREQKRRVETARELKRIGMELLQYSGDFEPLMKDGVTPGQLIEGRAWTTDWGAFEAPKPDKQKSEQ